MNNYHFSIISNSKNHEFDLIETDRAEKASVVLNGIKYSLLIGHSKDQEIIELFFRQIASSDSSSIEKLVYNLKCLPSVQEVQKSAIARASNIGTAISMRPKSIDETFSKQINQQLAVERGLLPQIPLPGIPIEPMSIQQRMLDLNVPGVSVTVFNKGEIWTKKYGQLDTPAASLIQAASISKTVAALTILSIINEYKIGEKPLSLDTEVKTLLDADLWNSIDPDGLATGENKMKIRHLLSHTAGTNVSSFEGYPRIDAIDSEIEELTKKINDLERTSIVEDISRSNEEPEKKLIDLKVKLKQLQSKKDAAFKGELPTTDDILKGLGNSGRVKVINPPGTVFGYSGGGTIILQKIIENITGKSYEEVAEERILKKLGMNDSTFSPDITLVIHGNEENGLPTLGGWHRYPELAAAGLWTTSEDLAKVALEIQHSLEGEEGIISHELAMNMLTAQTPESINGLGVFVNKMPHSQYFFHGGTNAGFRCIMISNDQGQGAAIMTNSAVGEKLNSEIILSIATVYDWPDKDSLPMLRPILNAEENSLIASSTPIEANNWENHVGMYTFESHTAEISIVGNKLFTRVDEEFIYETTPLTETLGLCQLDPLHPYLTEIIRFNKSEDGSISSLIIYGAEHTKTS